MWGLEVWGKNGEPQWCSGSIDDYWLIPEDPPPSGGDVESSARKGPDYLV